MQTPTRRRLVEWHAVEGRSPLVAAMAFALAEDRPCAPTAETVACAWIAAKFEEVEPPGPVDVVVEITGTDERPHGTLTTQQLVEGEARVLARHAWILPYRTPTRALLHTLGDADGFYDAAAHAMLWTELTTLLPMRRWALLLRDARGGVRVAPAVQLVGASLRGRARRVFRRFVRRVLPRRLRHRATPPPPPDAPPPLGSAVVAP
jgi:hypothetical protein